MRKWIIYLIIGLLVVCFMACKGTERIVEVPKTRIEYKDRVKEKVDSLYVHDSTFVYKGGDTVYMFKYRNVYRDKLVVDTLYINKVDSVAVPYPVERTLSAWEKRLIVLGKFFFVILLCVIAYVIFRIVWHRTRGRI